MTEQQKQTIIEQNTIHQKELEIKDAQQAKKKRLEEEKTKLEIIH